MSPGSTREKQLTGGFLVVVPCRGLPWTRKGLLRDRSCLLQPGAGCHEPPSLPGDEEPRMRWHRPPSSLL